MSDRKRSLGSTFFGGIMSVALLVVAIFALLNQQYIKDQVVVWAYTPSSSIETIENRIDLNKEGEFHFRATQPEIASAETFNKDCPRQETASPILGCYTSEHRIYIYDITNEQLDGIEEVTAAHEMLHAVWERMDDSERAKIGALLRTEYQKHTDNEGLVERMAYYQRTEPGQFENELHSILSTESRTLDPELETYYKRFFKDRQKVVTLYEKYNTVFEGFKNQADTLYSELTELGASIDARTEKYNADAARLSADIASFNARADNGNFSSLGEFNRERAMLISRSNQLDADRAAISADIEKHNTKYAAYQEVSSKIEILNKSIDSFKDLQPTPSV